MSDKSRPTLREVTRIVRETHAAYAHPDAGSGEVTLALDEHHDQWSLEPIWSGTAGAFRVRSEHVETLPGDGQKIDAVAVARRLIAGLP